MPTGQTAVTRRSVLAGVSASVLAFGVGSEAATGEPDTTETDQAHFTAPTVADGRVFYGTEDELRSTAGGDRWAVDTAGGFGVGAPTVAGDTVYARTHDRLYAVSRSREEIAWEGDVSGGTVSVDVGSRRVFAVTGSDVRREARLVAFDANGSRQWSRAVGDQSYGGARLANEHVVITTRSGRVVGVTTDGTTAWDRRLDTVVETRPAVVDRTAFLTGRDGRLRAFDTESGDLRWTTAVGDPVRASPVTDGTTVYTPGETTLTAVSPSGETAWTLSVGDRVTGVAVGSGLGAVVTDGGEVVAFDPRSGRVTARWTVGRRYVGQGVYDGFAGPPAIGDGRVFTTVQYGDVRTDTTEGN